MAEEPDWRGSKTIDWLSIMIYAVLVIAGWLNIYAAIYDPETDPVIYDLSTSSGKQLMWIGICVGLIIVIMIVDYLVFVNFAFVFYGIMILALLLVLIIGKEINGAQSWFAIGPFTLQPSEFIKFATALAVAAYFADPKRVFDTATDYMVALGLLILPLGLILLQPDTGSALVLFAFVFVYYREGLSSLIPATGLLMLTIFILTLFIDQLYIFIGIGVLVAIAIILVLLLTKKKKIRNIIISVLFGGVLCGTAFGIDYFLNNILQDHQRLRIEVLINPGKDPLGQGYNITQSKIAIGSGGFEGKGYLQGTQTKYDFVPEISTDFIFCSLAEEHGWTGTMALIIIYMIFLIRILFIADRQRHRFSRIYGYSVASIFFFHFMVNVGMTIGLVPVIGIPLPFFSYGGSGLMGFTILLFILLKLDMHRTQFISRS